MNALCGCAGDEIKNEHIIKGLDNCQSLPEGDPLPGGLQDPLVYRELLHESPVGLHDAPRPFHVAHRITLYYHQGSHIIFCVSPAQILQLSFKKYRKVVRIFVCFFKTVLFSKTG
jgi:hypothetical protein